MLNSSPYFKFCISKSMSFIQLKTIGQSRHERLLPYNFFCVTAIMGLTILRANISNIMFPICKTWLYQKPPPTKQQNSYPEVQDEFRDCISEIRHTQIHCSGKFIILYFLSPALVCTVLSNVKCLQSVIEIPWEEMLFIISIHSHGLHRPPVVNEKSELAFFLF